MRIVLQDLTKSYQNGAVPVLENLCLEIHPGEFLAIVGPSGCVKSTLLAILAGYEAPTGGRVVLDGVAYSALPVSPARFLVTQSPVFLSWLNVRNNVALGVRYLRHLTAQERARRVQEALRTADVESFADARIQELSGGMKQRVALARALAASPDLLLLDEPFSALHEPMRLKMAQTVREWRIRDGGTTVFVTHNLDEAIKTADRIVVLGPQGGRIRRVFSTAKAADLREQIVSQLL